MISSPGCLCRIAGASGVTSTRFWTISRPGALRSCRWRSVRVSPGSCMLLVMPPSVRSWLRTWPCRSAERAEGGSHLGREEVRLLPGGEVAAPLDLVEVDERGVGRLDPAARRPEDLAGKGGEADRDRDARGRLAR